MMFGLFGCQNKSTNPGEEFPPGYQKEIPWPSLADSPWPMNHHDPQSTGRSQYAGPKEGIIEWIYKRGNQNGVIESGISIDNDSSIYFGCSGTDSVLIALNKNGQVNFCFMPSSAQPPFDEVRTTPLILFNNNICFSSGRDKIFISIDIKGNTNWTVQNVNVGLTGTNIGSDGTIYFTDVEGILLAVNENGIIKWTLSGYNFNSSEFVSIVFSPDSKILYIPSNDGKIYSVNVETQKINWSFGNGISDASPLVDSYGNIYVITNLPENKNQAAIYSLKPDGTINWSYTKNTFLDARNFQDPTIDIFGNVYFGIFSLISLNNEGKFRWELEINGQLYSPLICDKYGNIYAAVNEGSEYVKRIIAVNKDGNIIWSLNIPYQLRGGFSPAIGADSKLYFPSWRSNLVLSIK